MTPKRCFSILSIIDRAIPARMIAVTGFILFQMVSIRIVAQTTSVSGNVSDGKEPLPGVSVTVKGSASGTVTDAKGNYRILAAPNAVLIFTSINYVTENITVNNQARVNVVLKLNDASLGEVVVIGYGSQKRENLTGAVSSIKGQALTQVPTSNLSNVLSGRLAGVFVAQGTGVPGVSSSVRVRSDASWNYSPPLFVIDGVVRDKTSFDALNANDIEDITVLKDGASSSIYGARASNGVI